MILNPWIISWNNIISNIENPEEQIQQNWIDLTLRSIQKLWTRANILKLDERIHTNREDIEFWEDNTVLLIPGIYDIECNEKINIPTWMWAEIFTRSTINRGWNFLHSWFWDTWYHWPLWLMFYVNVPIIIEKWVRIWQIIFHEASEYKTYDWIYNHKKVA